MICDKCGIKLSNVIAFGDDYADIDMLKLSGIGIAMGNAIKEVKEAADIIIGSNDEDGIAVYLENYLHHVRSGCTLPLTRCSKRVRF